MMSRFQQMTVQAANDALGPDIRKQLAFQADVLIQSIDKFSRAKDANGEQILRDLTPGQAPEVLVAPTINLQSALTYQEVMGGALGDPANILTKLNNIKSSLALGGAPAAADVAALQVGLSDVSKAQAKVGVLQNELDAAVQSAETQELNTETNRGSLLDTDLSEATAGLARANALLQAVQSIISGMDTNSLFKKL
jgi:flagellin-like hook-associated protein FlgL